MASTSKSGILSGGARTAAHPGSWKLDLVTHKMSVCPATRKILGLFNTDEIELSNLFRLLKPGFKSRLIREYNAALDSGGLFEYQFSFNTPCGKEKWLKISGIPYYRRWGTAEKMVGTIEDRTQQIAEENLSLAIVNHELRVPLTLIKLNAQFLTNMTDANLSKSHLRVLNTVDLHVNSMVNLMDEYLSPYGSDRRLINHNNCVFNLCELSGLVVNEMRMLHAKYRFSIQVTQPLWVKADKYKILQVLINYITNAVNFSRPSSLIIVRVTRAENWAEVGIIDQGVGIPVGEEQKIFQKYYRCESRSARNKNGKGLGLYLVNKILLEHGGKVGAGQVKKGGSVFYFALPICTDHENIVKIEDG